MERKNWYQMVNELLLVSSLVFGLAKNLVAAEQKSASGKAVVCGRETGSRYTRVFSVSRKMQAALGRNNPKAENEVVEQ